jgi:hypothetical protein
MLPVSSVTLKRFVHIPRHEVPAVELGVQPLPRRAKNQRVGRQFAAFDQIRLLSQFTMRTWSPPSICLAISSSPPRSPLSYTPSSAPRTPRLMCTSGSSRKRPSASVYPAAPRGRGRPPRAPRRAARASSHAIPPGHLRHLHRALDQRALNVEAQRHVQRVAQLVGVDPDRTRLHAAHVAGHVVRVENVCVVVREHRCEFRVGGTGGTGRRVRSASRTATTGSRGHPSSAPCQSATRGASSVGSARTGRGRLVHDRQQPVEGVLRVVASLDSHVGRHAAVF